MMAFPILQKKLSPSGSQLIWSFAEKTRENRVLFFQLLPWTKYSRWKFVRLYSQGALVVAKHVSKRFSSLWYIDAHGLYEHICANLPKAGWQLNCQPIIPVLIRFLKSSLYNFCPMWVVPLRVHYLSPWCTFLCPFCSWAVSVGGILDIGSGCPSKSIWLPPSCPLPLYMSLATYDTTPLYKGGLHRS